MAASARVVAAVAWASVGVCAPKVAWGFDPFEIQVYSPEVDAPGHPGLELHSIYFASGHTATMGQQMPLSHQLHETLEPSVGLGSGFELGGYFQTALLPDGVFHYAGVKLRLKWHLPVREDFPLQFALNLELSRIPVAFDDPWGSELRPIMEWHPGHLVVDFNPIVTVAFTGPYAGIPAFEPCISVRYELFNIVAPGVEYYASFGPVTAIGPWSTQGQYVLETVDVLALRHVELHFGVGEGLTATSQGVILNAIVGYDF